MYIVELSKQIKDRANGLYDRVLGKNLKNVMSNNEPYLRDFYMKNHNMDLKKTLKEMPNSVCEYNELLMVPMFGHENVLEYYESNEATHVIKDIERPTLFMYAIDDPIVGTYAIDYESIRNNKFTVLATT